MKTKSHLRATKLDKARVKVLRVEKPVSVALSALSEEERAAVQQVLQSYRAFSTVTSDGTKVSRLSGAKRAKALRVTPGLRLIYEEDTSSVRVRDLIRAEAIDRYASFDYDVFVSHSSKDTAVARELAEQLRRDGLNVWFAGWEIRSGDPVSQKIEEALAKSRTLILCLSKNTLGTGWTVRERQAAMFRDPGNLNRRFVPVLIDNASIGDALSKFAIVDWRERSEQQYARLLSVCQPSVAVTTISTHGSRENNYGKVLRGHADQVASVCVSADGRVAVSASTDSTIRIWDLESGTLSATLKGHRGDVTSVDMTPDGGLLISGSADGNLHLWEPSVGRLLNTFEGRGGSIRTVAITEDGKRAVCGAGDDVLQVWDLILGQLVQTIQASADVSAVAIGANGQCIVSGQHDNTVQIWNVAASQPLATFKLHTGVVASVAVTADGRLALSGSHDGTVRIWDLNARKLFATLEGHTQEVTCVDITPDGAFAVSGSRDKTVRLWDLRAGRLITTLGGHDREVTAVAIAASGHLVVSGSADRDLRVWDVGSMMSAEADAEDPSRYTNAKVLLVGDSGVGKTGLALRMTEGTFQPTASTDGAWASQLRLPDVTESNAVAREIFLWDFAGQSDYRLIHQLFMDEAALAVFVFNPQTDDPFEGIEQWDHALTRAAHRPFRKLLVSGRCDRGGLMVSQRSVERFMSEHGFAAYLETSALTGRGCGELQRAVVENIDWDEMPWTVSPKVFTVLKDSVLALRNEGAVLLRLAELRQRLEMELPNTEFTFDQLRAVVGLLSGPGLIWRLDFGDFVLLQPERINQYAAAVVRSVRANTDEIGCILEESVLAGKLTFQDMQRLPRLEEEIILRAMCQTFVSHGLCVREQTDAGTVLVFPSYFKREQEELQVDRPPLLSYRITGALDEIYSTLVARLHYTSSFEKNSLWRFGAEFKTPSGSHVSLGMSKLSSDVAEVSVYVDSQMPEDELVLFIRYVHDHLLSKSQTVIRERRYVCRNCGYPVESNQAVQERLQRGLKDIVCVYCEDRIVLLDSIEQRFASDEMLGRVRELEELARVRIDNQSRELILIGHVYTTAGETGQVYRHYPTPIHGIDGEFEFKDFDGRQSGKRVYVQIRSWDEYDHGINALGTDVFTIKNAVNAAYWATQADPVMLIVRTIAGEIRWMDVNAYLRRGQDTHTTFGNEIAFEGEQLTALSLLRMRDRFLASPNL